MDLLQPHERRYGLGLTVESSVGRGYINGDKLVLRKRNFTESFGDSVLCPPTNVGETQIDTLKAVDVKEWVF